MSRADSTAPAFFFCQADDIRSDLQIFQHGERDVELPFSSVDNNQVMTRELADELVEPVLDRYDLSNRLLSLCADQGLAGRSLADALAAGGRLVTRPHFNLRPQTRRG